MDSQERKELILDLKEALDNINTILFSEVNSIVNYIFDNSDYEDPQNRWSDEDAFIDAIFSISTDIDYHSSKYDLVEQMKDAVESQQVGFDKYIDILNSFQDNLSEQEMEEFQIRLVQYMDMNKKEYEFGELIDGHISALSNYNWSIIRDVLNPLRMDPSMEDLNEIEKRGNNLSKTG